MTYTAAAAQPTSPASPLAVTLFKDDWGAVRTIEANNTDKQRAIQLGEPVPIVFAKEASGIGGTWVYPGAARYAIQANTNNVKRYTPDSNRDVYEYTVNLGLVISEGQIGNIATSDIYKGALAFTGLSNVTATLAYGSMPSVGFNYVSSAIDADYETRPISQGFSDNVDIPITGNVALVELSQLMVVDLNLSAAKSLFSYQLLINGTAYYDDGLPYTTTPRDLVFFSGANTPPLPWTNVVLRILTPYTGANLEARSVLTVITESAAGADSLLSYGFPENPGSGGTFQGLSCLALKGTYPAYLTYGNAVESNVSTLETPGVVGGYISVSYSDVLNFSITAEVQDGGLTIVHAYELYVNNTLIRDSAGVYAGQHTDTIDLSYEGPFDVEYRAIPFPGSPFPATATGLFNVTYALSNSTSSQKGLWDDQVRCFVRNGIEVTNLLTSTTASSNNFADLVYYILTVSGNVPTGLIDNTYFLSAAKFIDANNLRFDGTIAVQMNIKEYLNNVAPFFLVHFLQIDGKYALRPVLPTKIDGTLDDTAITPSFTFDRTNIEEGSYSRQYIPLNDRKDICTLLTYRDQSNAAYSVQKIAEVRYTGTAASGPFQEFDLSEFCSNITQAGFVGKYILANRKHVTHTISFSTNIGVGKVVPMDIVRVRWNYADVNSGVDTDTRFYQISRVTESSTGSVQIEATHFPTDGTDKSLVIADILAGSYTGP